MHLQSTHEKMLDNLRLFPCGSFFCQETKDKLLGGSCWVFLLGNNFFNLVSRSLECLPLLVVVSTTLEKLTGILVH